MEQLLSTNNGIQTYLIEEDGQKRIRKVYPRVDSLRTMDIEIQALRNLNHPGIPRLLDVPANGEFSLTREYREGRSLTEYLKEGKLFSQEEATHIAAQLLDVLDYVHSQNILHRDIKPSNIIYNPPEISLVDFGLARLGYFSGSSYSLNGGTFGYVAPEQYYRKTIPGSDIFSLGATMVRILTGKDLDEYMVSESIFDGFDLSKLKLEPKLLGILKRMTLPDSKKRYQSALEVKTDLTAPEGKAVTRLVSEEGRELLQVIDALPKPFYPTLLIESKLEKILGEKGFTVWDDFVPSNYHYRIYSQGAELFLVKRNQNHRPWENYHYLTLKSPDRYPQFKKDIDTFLAGGCPEYREEVLALNESIEKRSKAGLGAFTSAGFFAIVYAATAQPLLLIPTVASLMVMGGAMYSGRRLRKSKPARSREEFQEAIPYTGKIYSGKEAVRALINPLQV